MAVLSPPLVPSRRYSAHYAQKWLCLLLLHSSVSRLMWLITLQDFTAESLANKRRHTAKWLVLVGCAFSCPPFQHGLPSMNDFLTKSAVSLRIEVGTRAMTQSERPLCSCNFFSINPTFIFLLSWAQKRKKKVVAKTSIPSERTQRHTSRFQQNGKTQSVK